MCGFLYIQQVESFKTSDQNIFDKGLELLEYRGPDNRSSLLLKNQYFGHVRLAIQDISEGSNQPVDDEYSTLLYNGEIYNFKDFQGHFPSDTLFLKDYLKKNQDLSCLNGMFSALEVRKQSNDVTLYRDFYGEKPLYYFQSNEILIISSTIKSIIFILKSYKKICLAYNQNAIEDYLMFGFVRDPLTIYEDIFSVPRNSKTVFQDGSIRSTSLFPYSKFNQNHFDDNISNCMQVSDVEPNLLLSSGIDSTYLLSQSMAQKKPIRSLSLSLSDSNDELLGIKKNLNHLKNSYSQDLLHEVFFDNSFGSLDLLNNYISIMEQPSSDGLNLFTLLNHFNSQDLKLIITGVGGDELFGGYHSFRNYKYLRYPGLNTLFSKFLGKKFKRFGLTNKFLSELNNPMLVYYFLYRLDFNVSLHQGEDKMIDSLLRMNDNYQVDHLTPMTQLKYFESFDYMSNQILRDNDNISMSYGIESRAPMLSKNSLHNEILGKSNLKECLSKLGMTFGQKRGFNSALLSELEMQKIHEYINENITKLPQIQSVASVSYIKIYTLLKWFESNNLSTI
jgi:asparagine synthase (glutamine-hydrolysing)